MLELCLILECLSVSQACAFVEFVVLEGLSDSFGVDVMFTNHQGFFDGGEVAVKVQAQSDALIFGTFGLIEE